MNHHFAPQAYLRQWCNNDGHLIRYVRKGSANALRLLHEFKTPRAICHQEDINRLPERTSANGLTEHGVESLLARAVDGRIQSIVKLAGARTGPLDASSGDKVRWLMQMFTARSPSSLQTGEEGVGAYVAENAEFIQRLLARAQTPRGRAEVGQFFKPQFPAVFVRANLAALANTDAVPMQGWYEGTVRVFQRSDNEATALLNYLGLSEFPTSEAPVVEWEENDVGLVASFSLSPDALAFVIQGNGTKDLEMASKHILVPMKYRESAICRSKASPTGPWHKEAQGLRPFTQGR
ncbi:DUF4238 domain-containing protein [Corallococcus macrosporus]|uniref:DUF4238 domain-containing protein n=1 Tax=Corallococcus macrosporus DSM 14697 TaxID=1189310 RepID=A0A250JVC2_9BACT|nr:DUF4238 domain-containing protein [Corallococcus macrosporus]ATB47814.1 hypothetical protein MYMAC_003432 [Corallococcus macrosporus DSM 14697]